MSSFEQCKAITEAGIRCSREAKNNGYCTQHYKIKQELPEDITNNVLSDYISYDELKYLENEFNGLKIDPKRIKIKETFNNTNNARSIKTYIDGDLRKVESWWENGNKADEKDWLEGLANGKDYQWYENGNIGQEEHWVNGKLEGIQKYYSEKGKLIRESNFGKNQKFLISEKFYTDDEKLLEERNYSNTGKLIDEKHYDDTGKLIEERHYDSKQNITEQKYYDILGNLVPNEYKDNQIIIRTRFD
jgi:antitoxin component YwqK of YwqJK toxin-antitoxin module